MAGMMRAGEPVDYRAALGILRIIHLAFCASIPLNGLAVYLVLGAVPDGGFAPGFSGLPLIRTLVWLLPVGCAAAIRFSRGRFLTAGSIVQWYVVSFALAEAIAVSGLVLYVIAGLLVDFLLLASIALLLLASLRPKEGDFRSGGPRR